MTLPLDYWLREALQINGRGVRRDWMVDIGGPCRFITNDWVALCLREGATDQYTEISNYDADVVRQSTRDYPPDCHWGTLKMETLRKWFHPGWWQKRTHQETLDRLLVFCGATGARKVMVNRALLWPLLEHLDADLVAIEYNGEREPVHLTSPGWRIVVMPMLPDSAYPLEHCQHWYAKDEAPDEPLLREDA
jgi:hypothetical protein